jgi:molybdopterin molybdotransferase
MTSILQALSCADDYDPNSLHVDRARQLILDLLPAVSGHERVFVRQALDRVLSEDVISPIDVPAHDNSAMDGWALRFDDLSAGGETRLKNIGTAFAGRAFAGKVGAGETVRIMTGAVLPQGVDCVVIQEVTRVEGDAVIIPSGQRRDQNTRRAGEDLQAGRPAIPAGRKLRPAEIGIIASLGIGEVSVRRRVRVAIFSTGDELCSIGTPLAEGAVYDSNRYTLWGMLTRLGCEVIDMGVVKDDPAALEAAFREAAACADAIITSGGVSVGEADFIKRLMAQLGEVAFWKIAMKPGRPMAFGRIAPDGADQPRRLAVRPARQPGGGDGDLLPVRAPRHPQAGRPRPHPAGAVIPGALHGADEEGPGPHRIPARHPLAGKRRMVRAPHRRPGLRRAALDGRCRLLHRARARTRKSRRRRHGDGAADGRAGVGRRLTPPLPRRAPAP